VLNNPTSATCPAHAARAHINLWHIDGLRAPATGRRQHQITVGFEFSPEDVPLSFPGEQGITQRSLLDQAAFETEVQGLGFAKRVLQAAAGEVAPAKQSNGDPTLTGTMLTMQSIQNEQFAQAAPAAPAGVTGQSWQHSWQQPQQQVTGASAGQAIPNWAATPYGYYDAGGNWVSGQAAQQQRDTQSGGSGTNKGLVVGLSVGGALVGLVSLFTAGVLIRRRVKSGDIRFPDVRSPFARRRAAQGAIGSSASSRRVSPLTAEYQRISERQEEEELNPLSAGSSGGHPVSGSARPRGPSGEGSGGIVIEEGGRSKKGKVLPSR
jgi:hypothetical protein